jgi:hypothetical protein
MYSFPIAHDFVRRRVTGVVAVGNVERVFLLEILDWRF